MAHGFANLRVLGKRGVQMRKIQAGMLRKHCKKKLAGAFRGHRRPLLGKD